MLVLETMNEWSGNEMSADIANADFVAHRAFRLLAVRGQLTAQSR